MIISALNPATIGGAPPMREYVALAERYGFGGVEFGLEEAMKMAEETSWDTVRSLFIQYEVAPAVFGLPVNWRTDEATFKADLAALPDKAQAAAELGCQRTGTWLPPAIDGDPREFSQLCTTRFLSIANVLAEYNIRLALEYVAPLTLRQGPSAMGKNPFIFSQAQALDLIDQIDAPAGNVGLLLDTFHWYTSHGSVDNILSLQADQVVHVHINDAPDKPIDEQIDMERLLPGDGVIDVRGFLSALKTIGYSGFIAPEVFNKELAALGPEAAAERTEAAVMRVMSGL